jgi:drug/metabolite transporter (DMT)-like permease
MLALRMLVAFPFFAVMALQRREANAPRLTRADGLRIVALGMMGYYLASYLDFLGLELISPTLERLIVYLNPTLVLFIGLMFFGRKVTLRQVIALTVSYLGIVFAVGADLHMGGGRNTLIGSFWVFLSALAYAIYLVGSGEMVRRVGPLRLTAYASCVACAACLVQFIILRPLAALEVPAAVYWLSLLNGTVCTVLPVFAVMLAIRRVGAATTSQIGLVGPVATIALSALVLGERLGIPQVIGTALVMSGVYIVSRPVATGEK